MAWSGALSLVPSGPSRFGLVSPPVAVGVAIRPFANSQVAAVVLRSHARRSSSAANGEGQSTVMRPSWVCLHIEAVGLLSPGQSRRPTAPAAGRGTTSLEAGGDMCGRSCTREYEL